MEFSLAPAIGVAVAIGNMMLLPIMTRLFKRFFVMATRKMDIVLARMDI